MNKTLASLILTLVGGASMHAHAVDNDEIVKYRKNVMSANGGLMGAANAILQNKVDRTAPLAAFAKSLEAINGDIAALFPKGSDKGDTDAMAEVWSKRAEFERLAKDTQGKAVAFAKAAGTNAKDTAAKFKELSDSCKACHKGFRK
jgi:cytochrome c556